MPPHDYKRHPNRSAALPRPGKLHEEPFKPENEDVWIAEDPEPPLPKTIKIDLDTPLEKFLSGAALCAGVGGYIFFRIGIDGKHGHQNFRILYYIPFLLLFGAIALLLRKFVDNYYVVESHTRRVFYHFKTPFWKSFRVVFRPDEVYAISVTGVKRSNKNTDRWEYQIRLVDSHGDVHAFSDFGWEDWREKNQNARLLARALGCKFIEGQEFHHLVVRKSGDQIFVTQSREEENIFNSDRLSVFLTLILILSILLFIEIIFFL